MLPVEAYYPPNKPPPKAGFMGDAPANWATYPVGCAPKSVAAPAGPPPKRVLAAGDDAGPVAALAPKPLPALPFAPVAPPNPAVAAVLFPNSEGVVVALAPKPGVVGPPPPNRPPPIGAAA